MKPKKARLWLVPLFCYAAALLLWLAAGGVSLALSQHRQNNGELNERPLEADMLYLDGVQLRENGEGGFDLVSENPDPQIIYSPGEAFRVNTVTFRAEAASRPGGEMTLFYTAEGDEGFSQRRRLWAKQAPDGAWVFDLGGRKVTALRFDPDAVGGVLWRNWQLTLNEPKPLYAHFLPDARPLTAFLFAPALLSAALIEVWYLIRAYLLRRKAQGKNRPKASAKPAKP